MVRPLIPCYLHKVTRVDEHLRYAFDYPGRWLAVATWSAAAFHLKDRERFIGWSLDQCCRRRPLVANNSRLLVLPEVREFRRSQTLAYPLAGMICLMVMAVAQGVIRGPKKTTFPRVLPQVDDHALERVLVPRQDQILGPPQDRIGLLDGKKVRHGGVEIVNAVDSTGRFLGSVITASARHGSFP